MRITVCIKQVPDTNKVEVDPVTGVLKRSGVDSKMNPYDLYAVETAMRLKEQSGGSVCVITMGPPQAEAVIKEAYSLGADTGVLLTDRAFAGADVLATSRAISAGIKKSGDFDLIICGKQSTDGDTAQVGPEISEWLNIPSVTNVKSITSFDETSITVERETPSSVETLRLEFPCLISVDKDIYIPRLPSYLRKKATADREILRLGINDLEDSDEKHYGLNGSPTQVQRIFPPESNSTREIWTGDGQQLSEKIIGKLKELKFVREVK
ncbi:MAG: electron transfer flavoprotein subunit beta/FixA family protein [Clostridia bacterium]|nr:electron transfer flavoprotein subunit beta/FixA family protein [Clostridia bacterium]